MSNKPVSNPDKTKHYPPIYEKLIPILIGVLILVVVVVLIFALGIAGGFISVG